MTAGRSWQEEAGHESGVRDDLRCGDGGVGVRRFAHGPGPILAGENGSPGAGQQALA